MIDPFFQNFPGVRTLLNEVEKARKPALSTAPLLRAGYELVPLDALTAWTITLFSEPDIRFLNRRRKRLVHYKERRHTIPDFLIRLPQTLNHRVYPILAKRNAAWPQWIKHQGLLVYLPGTLDFILAQACQKALAFHLKQLGRAA